MRGAVPVARYDQRPRAGGRAGAPHFVSAAPLSPQCRQGTARGRCLISVGEWPAASWPIQTSRPAAPRRRDHALRTAIAGSSSRLRALQLRRSLVVEVQIQGRRRPTVAASLGECRRWFVCSTSSPARCSLSNIILSESDKVRLPRRAISSASSKFKSSTKPLGFKFVSAFLISHMFSVSVIRPSQ